MTARTRVNPPTKMPATSHPVYLAFTRSVPRAAFAAFTAPRTGRSGTQEITPMRK